MPRACDENTLLRYVLRLLPEREAAEARDHLAMCASCTAYLRTFDGEERLPTEDTLGTSTAVDDLLTRTPDRWERLFAHDRRRYATPAGVQALIEACEAAIDHDLVRADLLSTILTESADALPSGFAARTLQALAWTRRATVLLRRGELTEAQSAVANAEARASHIPAADYERALIAFTASDILRELGRTDDALREIRGAAAVFAAYRDTRRYASAREMEAAVLFRRGEYEAAASLYAELLTVANLDDVTRARLTANTAQVLVKIGEYERALPLFEAAEALFSTLQYESYVARIVWGKARAYRAAGDVDVAIEVLRNVWARFEERGAVAEWIRVGVELAEWLLPTGAYAEVCAICNAVHARAVEAAMALQAIEAVSYMRDAAVAERLTADRAAYVRAFLESLPSRPDATFQAPA
jgi:tetratricopeptide (TPR) repeat protein